MHEGTPKIGNSEIFKRRLENFKGEVLSPKTRLLINELLYGERRRELPLKKIEKALIEVFKFATLTKGPRGDLFVIEQTGVSGSYTPVEALDLLEEVLKRQEVRVGGLDIEEVGGKEVELGDEKGILDVPEEDADHDREDTEEVEDGSAPDTVPERLALPEEFELRELTPATRYFVENVLASAKEPLQYKEMIQKALVELFGEATKKEKMGVILYKISQVSENGEKIFHEITFSEAMQALFDAVAPEEEETVPTLTDIVVQPSDVSESEEEEATPPSPVSPSGKKAEPTVDGNFEGTDSRFERQFNITQGELESIPGYKELSEPQRKLLYEQFTQLSLGYVQEEADRLLKLQSAKTRASYTTPLIKYLQNGALAFKESMRKTYDTVNKRHEVLDTMREGGIEQHKALLEQLVAGMPRVHETPEGELLIDLVQISERLKNKELRGEEYEILKELNSAAHAFSRIPSEWRGYTLGVDTHEGSKLGNTLRGFFNRKEIEEQESRKTEYLTAYGKYRAAQSKLDALYKTAGKSEMERIQILAGLDSRVTQMQFLQTDPKALEVIQKIDEAEGWKEVVKEMLAKSRSGYVLGGLGARAILGATVGFVAAPLVSAGFASLRSWDRTAAELRERDRQARKGSGDQGTEALNIISSADAREKMILLIERFKKADAKTRSSRLAGLQARVEYIRDKQMTNRISYGERDSVLSEQVQLNAVLGEAVAIIAAEGKSIDDLINTRLGKTRWKLATTLANNQNRIIDARHTMRERTQVRDAALGAGAGALGVVAGSIFAEKMFSGPDLSTVSVSGALREAVEDGAGNTYPELPDFSEDGRIINSTQENITPISTAENISAASGPLGSYEVQSGDTLINIIKEKIPEISGLSTPKAQDNAILNILGKLTAEQKEAIGISSGNVNLIFAGGKQDVLDLDALHEIIVENSSYVEDAEARFGLAETAKVPVSNMEGTETAEIPKEAEAQTGRGSEEIRRDIQRLERDIARINNPLIVPEVFHEKTTQFFRIMGNVSERDWAALRGIEMNKLLNSSYLSRLSESQNDAVRSLLGIQNMLNRTDVRVLPQNGETVERFFNRLADAKLLSRDGIVDMQKIQRLINTVRPAQFA